MDWLPESIRLYGLSAMLEFNHLPVAGGLYDQHPQLLQEWSILQREINDERKRQEARSKAKRK